MKISFLVNPQRTSYSTALGWLSARQSEECDEIATLLTQAGVEDVAVFESAGSEAPDSDFFFVFETDVDWHLDAMFLVGRRVDAARVIVLRPSRDIAATLAEQLRPGALVFYVGATAWMETTRTALVVRRAVAEPLGWKPERSLHFHEITEHYGTWNDKTRATLAERVVDYLRALLGTLR